MHVAEASDAVMRATAIALRHPPRVKKWRISAR